MSEVNMLERTTTALETLDGRIKSQDAEIKVLKDTANATHQELVALKKARLTLPQRAARLGQVSEDCARHLGGIVLLAGLQQRRCFGDQVEGMIKDILGVEARSALTSSDIPLPVGYASEVVELVSQYSAARQYGTVFPLGNGVVNLPRLRTDPVFGLIAASATVTEVSPQTEWVTFTAQKFGGAVRLPNEIDQDSVFAMGQFLARYGARQIARVEDHNFFVGTGAGSGANGAVKGLCFSTIDNSKVTQMGSTKTKYSDATLANLRAVRSVVDAPAIGMGAYYMHPTFEQHLAGLNTAGDKPYTANGINGASLDGFPIKWVDVMPAYSTSANASKVFALFGAMEYQYLGVRRGPEFASSDVVGFATDEILVRALERFTIGLMAVGAIAGLETAAS